MSAFQHGPAHLRAIVGAWVGLHNLIGPHGCPRSCYWTANGVHLDPRNDANVQAAFDLLAYENARSVNHRYDEHEAPVLGKVTRADVERWTPDSPAKIAAIAKAIDSLDYQSCETADWHQTEAFVNLGQLRRALLATLPGYEDADTWVCADAEPRPRWRRGLSVVK